MAGVKIPIGPQHPALKEPESFEISLRGERITGVGVKLGYNHRGIEKAAEGKSYIQNLYMIERVCGICSHSHATCFVQAVEEVAGVQIPKRANYLRSMVAELERIHSHLLWLGVAGHEVGFDTLLMYSWRDREVVMDLLALLTGNRVNYSINTFGGIKRDITPEQIKEVLKGIDILEERTKYYIQVATEEITLIKRLSGVGGISHEDCVRFGATGPTSRASNVNRDVRRDDPYAGYSFLDFKVIVDNHCDVYGRTLVRVGELMESYKMIRQILTELPDGEILAKMPKKIPVGEAFSRFEAPRGENVHYIRGNGTDRPERLKVRAPTLANAQAIAKMLENNQLADVPIVIAAIDPCFSCTDRMLRLDHTVSTAGSVGGTSETVNWKSLRDRGVEWYRSEMGIDFTDLNKKLLQRMGR